VDEKEVNGWFYPGKYKYSAQTCLLAKADLQIMFLQMLPGKYLAASFKDRS